MIIKERDLVGIKLILNSNKVSSSILNFKLCVIESDKASQIKRINSKNSFIYKDITTKQYRKKKTGEYILTQESQEILDELLSVFSNTKEICKIAIQYFISRTDRMDKDKEELKSIAMEITDEVFDKVEADEQTLILIIHQEVTKHLLKMDWWKDNEAKRIEALRRVEDIKQKLGGVYGEI
ncbi:hypothetical protein B5591_22595 [Salmonella enterica]|nr:hypothetical protein [Salmonella enterica]